MPIVATAAAAGATSLVLDTLTGLPADPQYRVVVGSEELIVSEQSGTTITFASPTTVDHSPPEAVASIVEDGGVRGELVADVRLDATGLVIDNGKLTMRDPTGSTVLGPSGFSGTWLRFLMNGLYNSNFAAGTAGALTFGAAAGSELPYWSFSGRSASTVTATRVADSGAPGGYYISIKSTTSTGVTTYGNISQAYLPVQGGRRMVARVGWRAVGATSGKPCRIRVQFNWYTANLTFISATVTDGPDRTATGASGVYQWDICGAPVAPTNAALCSVLFRGHWENGAALNAEAQIAETVAEIHDNEFTQIIMANNGGSPAGYMTFMASTDVVRLVGDNPSQSFNVYGADSSGTVNINAAYTGEAWPRAAMGRQSGDTFFGLGDGASFYDVKLRRTGAAELTIEGHVIQQNIAAGQVTITPVANTPTSTTVTGLNVSGTNFYPQATAATTVPGTVVTGVGATSPSSSGVTIYVTRTNTTNTAVNWLIVGI